jgi:uncharacterized membrane protein YphA (DoxX/SURF4 family)
MEKNQTSDHIQSSMVLMRVILGVIILVTWYDNLTKGLYTADGLTGFFNWLFDAENGNSSSLTFYKSILDTIIIPIAGVFGGFQMVTELLMGMGLLLGGFTRFFGVAAVVFFLNLFLAYFGGHEWIWTYVLLLLSALAVAQIRAGRRWGIDQWITRTWGEPPLDSLW